MLLKSGRARSSRARRQSNMYELNRTQARRAFKDLLGQANHFLITILVGLNGVRNGKIGIEEEFRTSWNPKSVERSAERSRIFVLDLALIRAIDALDTYMMMSARRPCAFPNTGLASAMDGTGRSVARRLDVFDQELQCLAAHHKAILSVAIEWRNRRVHSLSRDKINRSVFQLIRQEAVNFRQEYSGLEVEEFIKHFNAADAPTFKEAAAVIRLTHEAVSRFDEFLLRELPVERYLSDALLLFLEERNGSPSRTIKKIWDHPKKHRKAIRLLGLVGVNETDTLSGRRVPDEFVDELTGLNSAQVLEFLKAKAESVPGRID